MWNKILSHQLSLAQTMDWSAGDACKDRPRVAVGFGKKSVTLVCIHGRILSNETSFFVSTLWRLWRTGRVAAIRQHSRPLHHK